MARLFPFRTETPAPDGTPRVIDLDDEDADAVFSALSSTTARRIYRTIERDPGTPSDIAESIDSSIQNVRYHLEKLENAGLVEVIDTWYSSRGNEMSVYAPANGPLIVTSDRTRATQLKDAVSRFIGGISVLAGASLLFQYGVTNFGSGSFATDDGTESTDQTDGAAMTGPGKDDRASDYSIADDATEDGEAVDLDGELEDSEGDTSVSDDSAVAEDTLDGPAEDVGDAEGDMVSGTEDVEDDSAREFQPSDDTMDHISGENGEAADGIFGSIDASAGVDSIIGSIPPGVVFFLGGLTVLIVVGIWWYRREYHVT